MNEKVKYCTICGKKREIVKSGKFNESDGKPELIYAECDVKDCKHGCHDYRKVKNSSGLLKSLYMGYLISYYECIVCGHMSEFPINQI